MTKWIVESLLLHSSVDPAQITNAKQENRGQPNVYPNFKQDTLGEKGFPPINISYFEENLISFFTLKIDIKTLNAND